MMEAIILKTGRRVILTDIFENGDVVDVQGNLLLSDEIDIIDRTSGNINWEERRYQIFRMMLWRNLFMKSSTPDYVSHSLLMAEEAIKKLKRTPLP